MLTYNPSLTTKQSFAISSVKFSGNVHIIHFLCPLMKILLNKSIETSTNSSFSSIEVTIISRLIDIFLKTAPQLWTDSFFNKAQKRESKYAISVPKTAPQSKSSLKKAYDILMLAKTVVTTEQLP